MQTEYIYQQYMMSYNWALCSKIMINFEKMIALLKGFVHMKFPITWKNGCFPLEDIYNIKKVTSVSMTFLLCSHRRGLPPHIKCILY